MSYTDPAPEWWETPEEAADWAAYVEGDLTWEEMSSRRRPQAPIPEPHASHPTPWREPNGLLTRFALWYHARGIAQEEAAEQVARHRPVGMGERLLREDW